MRPIRAPQFGRFGLAGLASSDPAAAVQFYSEVLGWQARRLAGGVTLMGDRAVDLAVVYPQTAQARAAGVAPHWSPLVAVADIGSAQASAVSLGAAALRSPFDAAGAGLIAPIRDPVGATVSLWEPSPARETLCESDAEGGQCRHELVTANADRARAFYAGLLAWSFRTDGEGTTTIMLAGQAIGAIRDAGPLDADVSAWIPCFPVRDLNASTRRAGQLGPRRLDRPGAAELVDPQGAAFALVDGANGR